MYSGTPAYGVIVEKKSRRPTGELLEFDGTQIIDGKLYAKISRRITVRDLGSRSTDRRASTLVEDIRACEELAIKNSVSSPAANNKLKEICGFPNVLATGVRETDVIALLSWLIELKKPRGGFYTCINSNLPECTAEAVVMRHTSKFRDSDVKKCRGRLASNCPDYLNDLESGSSQIKREPTLPDLIRSMGVELSTDFKVHFARDSKSSGWRPLQSYLDDLASFEEGQAQQSKKNFPVGGHVVSLINTDSSTRWLFVGVYAVNAVVPEKLEHSNFTYSMNRIAGLEHLEARVIVTCDPEGRNSYRTGQRIEDQLMLNGFETHRFVRPLRGGWQLNWGRFWMGRKERLQERRSSTRASDRGNFERMY